MQVTFNADERGRDEVLVLLRQFRSGKGLTVEQVQRTGQELVDCLGVPDAEAAVWLTKRGIALMPTSREKLAVIAALNLMVTDHPSRGADARRSDTVRDLDVSYSTALRLEQTGLLKLATIVAVLPGGKEWDSLANFLTGQVFSIEDCTVKLWPSTVPDEFFLQDG